MHVFTETVKETVFAGRFSLFGVDVLGVFFAAKERAPADIVMIILHKATGYQSVKRVSTPKVGCCAGDDAHGSSNETIPKRRARVNGEEERIAEICGE